MSSVSGGILEWVAEATRRFGDRAAVRWRDRVVTYAELEEMVTRVAEGLKANGVPPGGIVTVLVDDRIHLIATILGVFRAGCVYVPLDGESPDERLRQVVSELEPHAWLFSGGYGERIRRIGEPAAMDDAEVFLPPTGESADTAFLAVAHRAPAKDHGANPQSFDANAMRYVFYTSGSTGRPKGIAGTLPGLSHFIKWEVETFGIEPGWRLSHLTAPTFDASFRDILVALCTGATVCVSPDKPAKMEIEAVIDWLHGERIDVLHCVPSFFSTILAAECTPGRFPALKFILQAGEVLPVSDVKKWYDVFGERVTLVNLYGSTETTMIKLFHVVRRDDVSRGFIPIGRPMSGVEAVVLDQDGDESPPGKVGEIHIKTPYLALGYFNNPEATAKVFVPDPRGGDSTDVVYKTGDLGLRLEDGNLRFVGRKDTLVKIRGIRVELGEIEAALRRHPAISRCAVVVRDDRGIDSNLIGKEGLDGGHGGDSERARLVAYVVGDGRLTITDARAFLRKQLPEHMIPHRFVWLSSMPVNTNGKVDVKALPPPETTRPELDAPFVAARNPRERAVVGIWEDILGISPVGVEDNFFELGGDSLMAMRVTNRIRQDLERQVSIQTLFDAPSVAQLATALESGEPTTGSVKGAAHSNRDGWFPLSKAQQGIWFLWRMDPENPYYIARGLVELSGPLNLEALQRAWRALVGRHEMLRAQLGVVDGLPVQRFDRWPTLPLPLADLSTMRPADQEREIQQAAEREVQRPFDLEGESLWRTQLYRLSPTQHALLLTMHEITMDIWSIRVMLQDLRTLYQAFLDGDTPDIEGQDVTFGDYVSWDDQSLTRERLQRQEAHWREVLAGELPVMDLPFDRPRRRVPTYDSDIEKVLLDADLTRELNALGRRANATLFMTLLAAFKVLLRRYTNQDDLIVGAPFANRNHEGTESMISFFLNMLPLRSRLSHDLPFVDFLNQVRTTVGGAISNADYPFMWMPDLAETVRDPQVPPVFQVMFNMLNYSDVVERQNDLAITYKWFATRSPKYDLSLYAQEHGDRIYMQLFYPTDLFDKSTVERMMRNFVVLLRSILARPDAAIGDLELIDPRERQTLLSDFNATEYDFGNTKCLHELFEHQAATTPDQTALRFENQSVTYQELNTRANRLARYLRRRGVTRSTRVAICADRSVEMMVGLLGIMKAGGVYIALDPDYPERRSRAILEDTEAEYLVTHRPADRFADFPGQRILMDAEADAVAHESGADPPCVSTPADVLNIVYTSSTTGAPKGVLIKQEAVLNRLFWMWREYPFRDADVAVLQKSYALVAATWECFGALLKGVPTVILTRDEVRDPVQLWRRLVTERVSHLLASPPFLQGVLDQGEQHTGEWQTLRLATTSAEPLSPAMVQRWQSVFPNVPLLNLYGATECSSNASVYDTRQLAPGERRVPVGVPLANTQLYILDDHLRLLPMGATGELCVSGSCLAAGYLKRPRLTAGRFVPHPFPPHPDARLYRTGDLARHRPDGTIELMGRRDDQVKIRGFRVELADVETALMRHEAVQRCAVAVWHDGEQGKQLVAYVVTKDEVVSSALWEFLREHLPDYMVPADFVRLDALPLTSSGKVNRRELPRPERGPRRSGNPYHPPRTAAERVIANTWIDLLGVERIGVSDNFFQMGGHSLLATQMISRLRDMFHVDVPVRQVFELPTVTGMVEALTSAYGGRTAVDEVAEALLEIQGLSAADVARQLSDG